MPNKTPLGSILYLRNGVTELSIITGKVLPDKSDIIGVLPLKSLKSNLVYKFVNNWVLSKSAQG